jgi:hypothetical protein
MLLSSQGFTGVFRQAGETFNTHSTRYNLESDHKENTSSIGGLLLLVDTAFA